MRRFVVIATMRRGAVMPPEPVGVEAEIAIAERLNQEASWQETRVCWLLPVTRPLPPRRWEPSAKVARMMQLSEKAG